MFARGDLKYLLLEQLQERPKHGYELMKDLEDRSGGFYTPSAGSIYPTLQLLEDRGWVTSETVEGKKVYTISEAGKAALQEHGPRGETFGPRWGRRPWEGREAGPEGEHGHERGHHRHGPGRGGFEMGDKMQMRALAHEARSLMPLVFSAGAAVAGNPERLSELLAIIGRTRSDLIAFLNANASADASASAAPSAPASGESAPEGGPVEHV